MKKSVIREYTESLIIAVILALFVRTWVFQAFKIPTASMEPNLLVGDHLIVNKMIFAPTSGRLEHALLPDRPIRRGDIVVFKFPKDPERDFIKRVIGLPGDRIQMRQGQLFINDRAAELKAEGIGEAEDDNGGSEPAHRYIETLPGGVSHQIFKLYDNGRLDNTQEVTVPPGRLFVMGDNRDNSADSRVPVRDGGVGLLPMDDLVGRADAVVGSWDLGIRSRPVWTWLSGFRLARFFTAVH
jgi:signal peptidase I